MASIVNIGQYGSVTLHLSDGTITSNFLLTDWELRRDMISAHIQGTVSEVEFSGLPPEMRRIHQIIVKQFPEFEKFGAMLDRNTWLVAADWLADQDAEHLSVFIRDYVSASWCPRPGSRAAVSSVSAVSH